MKRGERKMYGGCHALPKREIKPPPNSVCCDEANEIHIPRRVHSLNIYHSCTRMMVTAFQFPRTNAQKEFRLLNQFCNSKMCNLRSDASFISRILAITAFSSTSSVLASRSLITSGIFMMWWTGATSMSVSWSFLHRGSRLHHY